MTNEAFQQGYLALVAAFPGVKFNAQLMWNLLGGVDGQVFLMAVMDIISTTKELFPGSNIIAILKERSGEIAIQERAENQLALEAETEKERIERWRKEASPMPEECRQALLKLGLVILE